jgi:hypothetical protein
MSSPVRPQPGRLCILLVRGEVGSGLDEGEEVDAEAAGDYGTELRLWELLWQEWVRKHRHPGWLDVVVALWRLWSTRGVMRRTETSAGVGGSVVAAVKLLLLAHCSEQDLQSRQASDQTHEESNPSSPKDNLSLSTGRLLRTTRAFTVTRNTLRYSP